jgi:transposase
VGLGFARSVITAKITRIIEEPRVEAEVTGSVVGALFGLDGFRVWPSRMLAVSWNCWLRPYRAIMSRACLTERARVWAFEQVGACDGAVSRVAAALGVGWAMIMRIVTARGAPIIDDPARLDAPIAIGVDETAFLQASGRHRSMYATGIADLTPGQPARLPDVVAGRSGVVLASWLGERDQQWKARVATASLDPFRGYATALNQQLPQAVRVFDPFHVTKLGLTAADQVRRRVQQSFHGHRGHRGDPLYEIRRVLRRRADRLSERAWGRLRAGLPAGDPDGEVTAAWTIAQDLMRCYRHRDAGAAADGFSLSNPIAEPDRYSVPKLLRRVADRIDELGNDVIVNDLILPIEPTGERYLPSINVYYYHDKTDE